MPHPSITAQTDPLKPAIIMADSGETVSYRELDQRSNQGAQLFRSLGLIKGDHICLMLENCRQFLEICWAAQRAGIIFTPVSTHLRESETRYILDNCGAKTFHRICRARRRGRADGRATRQCAALLHGGRGPAWL